MLGRLIAMGIPLFMFWMIYPQISQEFNNAANCIPNNGTLMDFFNVTAQPNGATDSFGGAGGDYHFGGYSGQVTHKDFVSSHAVVQTNESILNPECVPLSDSTKTLISYLPWMFLAGWLFVSWHWVYRFIGWGGYDDI